MVTSWVYIDFDLVIHYVASGQRKMLVDDNGYDELVGNLKRFWVLESLGIVEKDESPTFTDIYEI